MRSSIFFYVLFLVGTKSISQITFTKDIAHVIYNKCGSCHRPGEIGPFSLTNYDQVKNNGQMIKFVTQSKYMPPWKADINFQHYLDENYLTESEIKNIKDWVDNGMSYGNAVEEPDFPAYPEGSTLGQPDLVLNFKKAHKVKGNNTDEYWYFVLPTGLTQNKVVKAVELRPGNKKIVHHALFFQDTTGKARAQDEKTSEYGFSANTPGFDTDAALTYVQYPGYVPGQKPLRYPESLGQKMNKNADLVIQMHYAPSTSEEIDSSSVNIFFADEKEEIKRFVTDRIMLPFDLQGGFLSFIIPPNQKKTFLGQWKLNKDLSFLSVFPHMHLLGRKWKVWLERPNGSIENLIKIDDWDFNWQGGYYFTKFITAPKNSIVYAEAEYDNTTENPNNPSNPPVFVTWGEKTTDEMYYLPLLSVPYKNGDENVVFETTTSTNDPIMQMQNYISSIQPNPATTELINIGFHLKNADVLKINLFDQNGKFIKTIRNGEFYNQGMNYTHIDGAGLSAGTYFVRIEGKQTQLSDKLMILK
jgi:hypothetical protein